MAALKRIAIFFITIVPVILTVSPLHAGNLLVDEYPDYEGWINWEHQVVKAIGRGVLPGDVEFPEQARSIARDQSIVIAKRNLAMTLGNLRIDGVTKVSDLTASSSVIKEKIDKLVSNARLVSIKQIYDCSYEAILQINILGNDGLISAISPEVNTTQNSEFQMLPNRGIAVIVPGKYQPVLFPGVYDNKGRLIFSISSCRPAFVVRYGIVGYISNRKSVNTDKKSKKLPVVVKADITADGDIVLNQADALKLAKRADQLAKYGIYVLVDDRQQ